MICKSSCNENMEDVYDLVGRPELLEEIEEIASIIKEYNNVKIVYVPEIIEYLKRQTKFLERYKAIRVNPICTLPNIDFRYKFNDKNRAFIDTRPAIQFCILNKNFFNCQ